MIFSRVMLGCPTEAPARIKKINNQEYFMRFHRCESLLCYLIDLPGLAPAAARGAAPVWSRAASVDAAVDAAADWALAAAWSRVASGAAADEAAAAAVAAG